MMVLPSRDDVDSLAFPAHSTNTPRGCCPSMKSIAPFGIDGGGFYFVEALSGLDRKIAE
jgi:K+-transporting ATPase A subunit